MSTEATRLLLRDAEIHGWGRGDCRVRDGLVAEIGRDLQSRDDELVVEGNGGALLPGLADHHVHLAAMAAHESSLELSALTREQLASALSDATGDGTGWVRAVGYDDVAHGDLDREVLDTWNDRVPLRVQHRSGALWVVNGAGLARLSADTASHAGIERDASGRLTGRLWRADEWLRGAAGAPAPDLGPVGRRLAALGVTHVADATPDAGAAALVTSAVLDGDLPQHVMVMAADAAPSLHPRLSIGPVKLVVADHALPQLDELADRVRRAHAAGRPVAVHCVTRAALALTIAAIDEAGGVDGDRVEHCAVADQAAAAELAARGLRVVTQPTLVARRGDDYLDRAEPGDREDLWPYATLLDAGVAVAPSSDAPYGDPDPWACLRAATQRITRSGRVLGPKERVDAAIVLAAMMSQLADPGGPSRNIAVGQPADLVLLGLPLTDALGAPDADLVRVTVIEGRVAYSAEQLT